MYCYIRGSKYGERFILSTTAISKRIKNKNREDLCSVWLKDKYFADDRRQTTDDRLATIDDGRV
ncbi:MAG: hypothetical protein WDM90_09285 [Ferruginibacter sp.]